MNPVELPTVHFEIAGVLGAGGDRHRIEFLGERARGNALAAVTSAPDVHADAKLDSLGAHLLDAAIDVMFLELEIRDAVAKQPADAVRFLEEHNVVAGSGQLLRASHPRRTRSDDCNAFARS